MKKLIMLVAVIAIAFVNPAFSAQGGENNNTGCNGVGNANSPCEGNGGNATANGGSVNSTITNTNTNVNNNDVRSNSNANSFSNSSVRNRVSNKQAQGQAQDQTATANASNDGVNIDGDESTFIAPPSTSPMVGTSSAQITTPFGGVGFSKDAKHAKLITVLSVIRNLEVNGVLTKEEANTDSKNVYHKLLKTVCGRSCDTEDKE